MRVAIFSDIHGKILLPFKLVDLYQKETGHKIDLILQCGDMGAYPDIDNLDKATIKHAKHDRDELGFHDQFTKEDKAIKAFLDKLNINMICVRGNHEDHDYLDKLEQADSREKYFAIDVYKRVYVCKSGMAQSFTANGETLTFVGVGRIGDRKGRTEKRFIQEYERRQLKKLYKSNEAFDVLITHDKDDSNDRGYGMTELRQLLDNVIFKYHFYGHTGEPYKQELDYNRITQSVKVKELEFNDSGILEKGCMIILEKKDHEITIQPVDQSLTNWLTRYNWHG